MIEAIIGFILFMVGFGIIGCMSLVIMIFKFLIHK